MGNSGHPALQTGAERNYGWLVACCLFALTGMALRLASWSSQTLLDDEWHALNFVFTRSLRDVFLQQGLGANSIPVNVYCWLNPAHDRLVGSRLATAVARGRGRGAADTTALGQTDLGAIRGLYHGRLVGRLSRAHLL